MPCWYYLFSKSSDEGSSVPYTKKICNVHWGKPTDKDDARDAAAQRFDGMAESDRRLSLDTLEKAEAQYKFNTAVAKLAFSRAKAKRGLVYNVERVVQHP